MNFNLVQAMIKKGEVKLLGVIDPECFAESLGVNMKQLVHEWAGKLSKSSWKKEQKDDPEIGPIVNLLSKSELSQYKAPKDCLAGVKILLHFRNDLRLVDGLLYCKWWYKRKLHFYNLCCQPLIERELSLLVMISLVI